MFKADKKLITSISEVIQDKEALDRGDLTKISVGLLIIEFIFLALAWMPAIFDKWSDTIKQLYYTTFFTMAGVWGIGSSVYWTSQLKAAGHKVVKEIKKVEEEIY